MTPNTTCAPAAAPSVASEIAKQFASFMSRTGRSRRASGSRPSGRPLVQTRSASLPSPPDGAGGRAPLGRSESLPDGAEVVRRVCEGADRHAERVLVPARVHLHRDHQPVVFLAQART